MFTHDLDRVRHPASSRLWGMSLGTLMMVMVGASLISPRTLPYTAPFVLLGFAAAAWASGRARSFRITGHYGTVTVAAFLAFGLMSVLWAPQPLATFQPIINAAACCAACGFVVRVVLRQSRPDSLHIAEGFWIGLLFGLAYLLTEILTHQTIKLHLYNALGVTPGMLRPPGFFVWQGNKLLYIAPDDLTRNIAPVTPLLWAALLSVRGTAARRLALAVSAVLFALATSVVMLSEHETSKLALIGGTGVFLLGRWSHEWGDRILRVAWVTMCLAVVPISMALHRLDLHNAHWVQPTAQHRIVIWNHTAEQSLKQPVFGHGAGMMYLMLEPLPEPVAGEAYSPRVPHAHNVYLQTWYELGAVGAALLTLIGLAILERMTRLGREVAPYAQATFASASLVALSSYGMWQIWFMVLFALVVVAFAIGLRANGRAAVASPDPAPSV